MLTIDGTDMGPLLLFSGTGEPDGLSLRTIGFCWDRLLFRVSKLRLPITGVPRCLKELVNGVWRLIRLGS